MATEIAHEPASQRQALDINTGADKISGILGGLNHPFGAENREAPAPEPAPAAPAAEPEPEAEPTEDEQRQVAEAAQPAPEQEESPTEQVTEDVEAKETPATDETDETEVTSEIELEPAQVAALLGLDDGDIDVNDDGELLIHTRTNGKPAKATLRELRHSYELSQSLEERLRQQGRDRKAFEQESRATLESLASQHRQLAEAVQALEAEYAADFKSVNWDQLRAEDPAEYNARRLDYQDRQQRIAAYKADAETRRGEAEKSAAEVMQKLQTEGAKQLAEVFSGEAYRNAPKWDDQEARALAEWMVDQGFPAENIGQIAYWQVFQWARDSYLRGRERQTAKTAVKKVAKLPKVSKPGPKKSATQQRVTRKKGLKQRQRKSGGGLQETTDLIAEIMNS